MEAEAGIEPAIRDLQSRALPLCYSAAGARRRSRTVHKAPSRDLYCILQIVCKIEVFRRISLSWLPRPSIRTGGRPSAAIGRARRSP